MGPRVLRKCLAGLGQNNLFILINQFDEIIALQAGIIKHAAIEFHILERIFEQAMINTQHHISIHLDKPAIAIIGKTRIVGMRRQPDRRIIIEAQIKHRIHHSGH